MDKTTTNKWKQVAKTENFPTLENLHSYTLSLGFQLTKEAHNVSLKMLMDD